MCEVYLEAFFFLAGLRAGDVDFFFFVVLVARADDNATDLSAFSVILFSHASISEFSDAVTTDTFGAFGLRLKLNLGKPLLCNLTTNFLVAGVTLIN
jgi:hypothetical protein